MPGICTVPFNQIEILTDGRVFLCCPLWLSFKSIGNIYEEPIEKVWNSDVAKKIRRSILEGSNKFCNPVRCGGFSPLLENTLSFIEDKNSNLEEEMPLPKLVKFAHDNECNCACKMCRNKVYTNPLEKLEFLDSQINRLTDTCKNASKVCFAGNGDLFASRHYKNLLKNILEKYPDMKIDLWTNGLKCDETNCNELGISDKISCVYFSLHSLDKRTYENFVKYSNYDNVIRNVKWLARLKKEGRIDDVYIIFVVSSLNYQELAKAAKFTQKLGISFYLQSYYPYSNLAGEYSKLAIFDKDHKDYVKFAKLLKNKLFDDKSVYPDNTIKMAKDDKVIYGVQRKKFLQKIKLLVNISK